MSTSLVKPIHWSPGTTIAQVEQQVIINAYSFYRHNKTATANSLGISVRTLDQRLQKYGADDETLKLELEARKARQARELHRARFGGPAVDYETPAKEDPK